jgi:hypothetical protein
MAEPIMTRVPYEVTLFATDTKSGKSISNTLYYKTIGIGTYGSSIGGTDQATFQAAVLARWTTFILAVLSSHYVMSSIRSRAITGWKWGSPLRGWIGSSPSLTFTSIATATAHGFTSGNVVQLNGSIGATVVAGVYGPITVTGPNTFTIPVVLASGAVTSGTAQEVLGGTEFTYSNNLETTDTSAGSMPGEAAPLFCSASVRRLNAGVGRNWKSRISLSPFSESQVLNGKFEAAAFTAIQTAVDALNNQEDGGGGFFLYPIVVSKALAFMQPVIFPESTAWTERVTDFSARPNMGSLTSRKPRLTATIAS